MKQRKIKELNVMHYENGSPVYLTSSRTEEYAAVLAQAEAHQDLRFHATINNAETMIILPWESVIGVYATYETVDVAAPTDAICGGTGVFEVKMLDEIPRSASSIIASGDIPQVCTLIIMPFAATESMSYNGEPVTVQQFYQALEDGKASLEIPGFAMNDDGDFTRTIDCGVTSGEETVTMKFTYMGAATNVTATFPYSRGV